MMIIHHGAVDGVTGSCHQLNIHKNAALLIDCGLFQGDEQSGQTHQHNLQIDFDITPIKALLVTHCHIDHVGRIPWLIAAGFNQPIYCSQATAELLPLVLEDAIKIGITKNTNWIKKLLNQIKKLVVPVAYKRWQSLPQVPGVKIKFKPAGHILGSAYIEIDVKHNPQTLQQKHRYVFSGDLGAPYTPLLPAPKAPYMADTLVIESTYGDKNHHGRQQRKHQLQQVVERCLQNKGAVLIPAFSIGRTQELLYEIEDIIYKNQKSQTWQNITVILDSPLAAQFTKHYQKLSYLWDQEAKQKLNQHRHPLNFENLYTINSHKEHLSAISYIQKKASPCIVIAASGMCTGGRILNYLKALLPDERTDVLFVGYQARGTIGRTIQTYGPNHGYVVIDGQKININAGVYTLSGYSAHADQKDLINFVKRIHHKPKLIKIVHGDEAAKRELKEKLLKLSPLSKVVIAK
nr:MBL fold metallo-hydrolase [Gayadomonas joobiniege]